MADSPEVKVKLTAEDQGVAAAVRALSQELKNLKNQQDETRSSAVDLKGAFHDLIGAIAVERIIAFGKEILDSAVNIGNMSQKTGIATTTISVFHKVAEDTGIAVEAVDRGLVKAAKTVTLFQGGNEGAAKAMKLLNLEQKDFVGLNSDQKIQKLLEALGRMPDEFKKTTAAQLIFSKGGADMIVIANKLAQEGFGAIEQKMKSLGILMTQDFAENAAVAKESLQDLEDIGKGVATQFEFGLLPALADTSQALGKSIEGGSNGFEELGKDAGIAIKFIVLGFIAIGTTIGDALAEIEVDFKHVWADIKNDAATTARAVKLVFKGEFSAAGSEIAAGEKRHDALEADDQAQKAAIRKKFVGDLNSADQDLFPDQGPFAEKDTATRGALANLQSERDAINLQAQQKKITQVQAEQKIKDLLAQQIPLLAKMAEEETKLAEQRGHASEIARARSVSHQVTALSHKDSDVTGLFAGRAEQPLIPPIQDAAAKARLALALKHEQDLLAVWKAGAAQRAGVDKEEYERGAISLKNYFDRRRKEIEDESAREIAILKSERTQVQAAADLAGQQSQEKSTQAQAKAKGVPEAVLSGKAAPSGPDQAAQARQSLELKSQADRLAAEQLQDLARIDEIDTRIQETEINTVTKVTALSSEEFKQAEAGQQRELEFKKEIASLQGKTLGLTQAEINLETEKRTLEAHQTATSSVDLAARLQEIEQWKQLKTEVGAFDEAERKEATDQKQFEIEKRGIEIEQKAGLISRADAEKKISDLIKQRLPLLIQEAQAELRIAQASGNQEQIAKAQEMLLALRNLSAETITWQHQMQKAGEEAKTAITSDFAQLFTTLLSGTKSAEQAFSQFGLSILRSLEQIAAQMLANIVITKLLQAAMKAFGLDSGGGGAQLAKTIAQNDAMIVSNAGVAGAAAFASAMAVTPFPADIPVATAAMGTAVAIALSNLALGSAAEGAFLDQDRLIQAHAEEMILPREISLPLREALIQRPASGDVAGEPPIIAPEIAAGLRASINPGGITQHAAVAGSQALPPDIRRAVSTDLRSAIESGALSSPSIARPSDLRASSFNLPAQLTPAGGSGDQFFHDEIHLHHNGPDAKEVLERELVPRIETAVRNGRLRLKSS